MKKNVLMNNVKIFQNTFSQKLATKLLILRILFKKIQNVFYVKMKSKLIFLG